MEGTKNSSGHTDSKLGTLQVLIIIIQSKSYQSVIGSKADDSALNRSFIAKEISLDPCTHMQQYLEAFRNSEPPIYYIRISFY